MTRRSLAITGVAVMLLLCAGQPQAGAHAAPDHAEPKVGSTVTPAPTRVRIWFDDALEAVSTISVFDSKNVQVDRKDSRLDLHDRKVLEVGVPQLPPDSYRVIWKAVGKDGHTTTGDYTFTVK